MKKMYIYILLTCGALLLAYILFGMSSASTNNISGTYVSHYSSPAFIIQIVQIPGEKLQGRAEIAFIPTNGNHLDVVNYSVSGVVSGKNIVFSLENLQYPTLFTVGNAISGSVNGGRMQISGNIENTNSTWILYRSSQSVFNHQVAVLNAKVETHRAVVAKERLQQSEIRAKERFQKEKEQLEQNEIKAKNLYTEYCKYTANVESKLKDARNDFRKIVFIMKKNLNKESAIPPANSFAKSHILFIINNDISRFNGIGYALNNISIDAKYSNGTIKTKKIFHPCDNNSIGLCAQVNAAFNRAEVCNADLIAAFRKTYAVKAQEKSKQERIEREASSLAKQRY